MTLAEISKLPKGSYFISDPAKLNENPLYWTDMIHFYFGSKHKQVRRSSAFVYGLCGGVPGELPPVGGGMREGCGRKPISLDEKKEPVTVWPQQKVIDLWGGKQALRKSIMNFINSKI